MVIDLQSKMKVEPDGVRGSGANYVAPTGLMDSGDGSHVSSNGREEHERVGGSLIQPGGPTTLPTTAEDRSSPCWEGI